MQGDKRSWCAGKEIKDGIRNIASTRFVCHLQPPATITSRYLLSRWWFSVCITAKVRCKKKPECTDSYFTCSVSFSLYAESRFGERMCEKFISRKLKLAVLVEKSRNKPGTNSYGRTKLKKVLKTKINARVYPTYGWRKCQRRMSKEQTNMTEMVPAEPFWAILKGCFHFKGSKEVTLPYHTARGPRLDNSFASD